MSFKLVLSIYVKASSTSFLQAEIAALERVSWKTVMVVKTAQPFVCVLIHASA